jgi:hypothetical protein
MRRVEAGEKGAFYGADWCAQLVRFTDTERAPTFGTSDALCSTMEAKNICSSGHVRRAHHTARKRLQEIPDSALAPHAPVPAPERQSKRDLISAYFQWLCSGPVSEREREWTRRAHWRLA